MTDHSSAVADLRGAACRAWAANPRGDACRAPPSGTLNPPPALGVLAPLQDQALRPGEEAPRGGGWGGGGGGPGGQHGSVCLTMSLHLQCGTPCGYAGNQPVGEESWWGGRGVRIRRCSCGRECHPQPSRACELPEEPSAPHGEGGEGDWWGGVSFRPPKPTGGTGDRSAGRDALNNADAGGADIDSQAELRCDMVARCARNQPTE